MKKLIFFAIAIFLLSLWGFGVIFPDAGYVLFVLGQKTVETSLWFACFAVLIVCFVWWVASKFVRVSWSLAQQVTDYFVFGSTERASKRAASGLIDFLSGDWLLARKKLLRTAHKVELPLVNYLAAARCSYELGDREEALNILADVKKKYTRFDVAISLVQVKMEMADGRYDKAEHILLDVQKKVPKNVVVIQQLSEIYNNRQDWVSLSGIYLQIKKHKLFSANEILALETSAMVGQLMLDGETAARSLPPERLNILLKSWGKVPGHQQKNLRVVEAYAQILLNHTLDQEAEVLLRKTIGRTWSDALVNLYGLVRVNDASLSVRTAEEWLRSQPQNPILLRTLGRLSLRNQLWGGARDYFQRSLIVRPDAETYAELARLLNNLGEKQKSLEVYQEALMLNIKALPDLPQPTKAY